MFKVELAVLVELFRIQKVRSFDVGLVVRFNVLPALLCQQELFHFPQDAIVSGLEKLHCGQVAAELVLHMDIFDVVVGAFEQVGAVAQNLAVFDGGHVLDEVAVSSLDVTDVADWQPMIKSVTQAAGAVIKTGHQQVSILIESPDCRIESLDGDRGAVEAGPFGVKVESVPIAHCGRLAELNNNKEADEKEAKWPLMHLLPGSPGFKLLK